MRLSIILVVAAATFLVSCDAVAGATQSEQMTIASIDAAPVKSSRSLRIAKPEEEDESEDDLEEEERMVKLPSFKMLTPIDELLAKLSMVEVVKLANLNKFDDDILAKIKTTKGAAARISRWSKEEFTPTTIANLLKKYPSISRDGPEWSAWKLYAAQYLRKANSLKPTL